MVETLPKILQIIEDKLAIESASITREVSFSDLGVDSLDHYSLIMEIEKEFKITIPDEDAEKLTTPHFLITYVEKSLFE